MVLKYRKTFVVLALAFLAFASITAVFFMGMASAAPGGNPTATVTPMAEPSITPTPNATVSPTAKPNATVSPTPSPTPAPRQVFTAPRWDTDHESISVTNNGSAITVIAWIDSPAKKATISVGAGESMTVSTPSIQAQNGQIVSFGFEAYQNDTLIDSYNKTIAVIIGPTPTALPAESVTLTGMIVDADNGSGIAGAAITFKPLSYTNKTYSATTDASGSYTSPKMYPDVYKVTVSAAGYQALPSQTTDGKITEDSTLGNIALKRSAAAVTPTPTPVPPTPTPNPLDAWMALLSNPIACLGSLTALVTAVGGSIGIYEWMEKRKNLRLKEKDEPPGSVKKP